MKDLVILCADKDMKFGLDSFLKRHAAIGIRPISYDIFAHSEHDPACARRGVEFLRSFAHQYQHALLIFDRSGSGMETVSREELQQEIHHQFLDTDWADRARTIVIDPELETWIWNASAQVDEVAGWTGRTPPLRTWLRDKGWWPEDSSKPPEPKEAFLAALRESKRQKSASLYQELGRRLSSRGCTDPALQELLDALREWFPL